MRRTLAVAAIGGVLGCPSREALMQAAIDDVAAAIGPADSDVAEHLASTPNPEGEGIVVYDRAGPGCARTRWWLWLGNADDIVSGEAARTLTPQLTTLANAPPSIQRRIGFDGPGFHDAVRQRICEEHPSPE